MSLIFLDIDGVLSTSQTYNRWRRAIWESKYPNCSFPQGKGRDLFKKEDRNHFPKLAHLLLDEECCEALQSLIRETEAKIIISSSWRNLMELDDLTQLLRDAGIDAPILGKTTSLGHRGLEIKEAFSKQEVELSSMIILEDEEDCAPFNGRVIRTTFNGSRAGFRERHIKSALERLGKI